MKFKELKSFWYSDLFRYEESQKVNVIKLFVRQFISAGFRYTFWMRVCRYLSEKNKLFFPLYLLSRLILQHYKYKFGISISPKTDIGKGFYIGHFGGIVVNSMTKIGKNCNLSHGVTIGLSNRGKYKGVPTIGDNVYIGAGAKIIGSVQIGNFAAIGANCVVTKDVPDYGVVVGSSGKIISTNGSDEYVGNTNYDF